MFDLVYSLKSMEIGFPLKMWYVAIETVRKFVEFWKICEFRTFANEELLSTEDNFVARNNQQF